MPDWAAHARREEERYREGQGRLPGEADPDARQRQLTRLGNAAAGCGLSHLMAGNTEFAREWFGRAVERYRESFGRTYEDFTVGDVYEHRPGRTITEPTGIWVVRCRP